MYTIYHIPGVKIGCTNNPEKRIKEQGYESYEILEEHNDIIIASNREIALQKEYGYSVDWIPYYKTINAPTKESRIRGGKTAGKKNGPLAAIHGSGFNTIEFRSKGGKVGGKIAGRMAVESGVALISLKIANSRERICPYCNKNIKGPNYFKWHGDKCKAKPQ